MKKRYSILHKLLEGFLRGAQGGSYGKKGILLFFGFCCLIPLLFAAFFHLFGAFWSCTIAAVSAALALAHFDAYESEIPAEPQAPACRESACLAHPKKALSSPRKNAC